MATTTLGVMLDDATRERLKDEGALQVFLDLAETVLAQSVLRTAVIAAYRRPEADAVPMLLHHEEQP